MTKPDSHVYLCAQCTPDYVATNRQNKCGFVDFVQLMPEEVFVNSDCRKSVLYLVPLMTCRLYSKEPLNTIDKVTIYRTGFHGLDMRYKS